MQEQKPVIFKTDASLWRMMKKGKKTWDARLYDISDDRIYRLSWAKWKPYSFDSAPAYIPDEETVSFLNKATGEVLEFSFRGLEFADFAPSWCFIKLGPLRACYDRNGQPLKIPVKPTTSLMAAIFRLDDAKDNDFFAVVDGKPLHDALMEAVDSMATSLPRNARKFRNRVKHLIRGRHGFDGETKTWEELGSIFGVTKARARQQYLNGIWRMASPSRRQQLEAYIIAPR